MREDLDHGWLKQGSTASADVQQSYDDWAESYDGDLAEWDYRAPAEAARLLAGTAPLTATVLDAGCGTGLAGHALRAAGFTGPIDGIDLSQASLQEAAKRGIYRDLGPANLQDLPLAIAADRYDALVCIGVLTYVPDSEAILREFARLVRPGGTVLVTQRDDLFAERDFGATVERLRAAGVFADATITEPKPYLPGNPDFAEETRVVYVRATVT